MSIIKELNGKNILIWGYGREGQSSENFLKSYCPDTKISVFEGKRDEINDGDYDLVIKSPGIVMDEENPKFTSQTELFLMEFGSQVIGITGTKGKSTTSAMLYHALKKLSERNVVFLGNIGEPCLNYFGDITEDTIIVFEMSCHQLAHVDVSPHIALFLNLYEEHLDYYGTMEKYFHAKANITKFQSEDDLFYVGDNVPHIETKAKTSVIKRDERREYDLPIFGEHNNYNAEFVIKVIGDNFGFSKEQVLASLKDFKGLSHRLEFIGIKDGVSYYDDSISTIPQASVEAITSLPNVKTVLIGGMDRGINYDLLKDFIENHNEYNYILSYSSGKRIYDEVKNKECCYFTEDLKEAVELAKKITPSGMSAVLSPAAASYGYFKNFEHRGNMFREYVGL